MAQHTPRNPIKGSGQGAGRFPCIRCRASGESAFLTRPAPTWLRQPVLSVPTPLWVRPGGQPPVPLAKDGPHSVGLAGEIWEGRGRGLPQSLQRPGVPSSLREAWGAGLGRRRAAAPSGQVGSGSPSAGYEWGRARVLLPPLPGPLTVAQSLLGIGVGNGSGWMPVDA